MMQINDLRVSWIWVEVFPDSMKSPQPIHALQRTLAREEDYREVFEQVKDSGERFSLPWNLAHGIQRFWMFYLRNTAPKNVYPTLAWKQLVPIRERLPHKVNADSPLHHPLSLECFHYPHGFALVVTASLRGEFEVVEAARLAQQIYLSRQYQVAWEDGAQSKLRLRPLATEILDRTRRAAFSPDTLQGLRTSEPFSVATFIRGQGVDVSKPPPQNGDVHHALEGLCGWHNTFENDTPHEWQNSATLYPNRSPSKVLYSLERGRAVWFPSWFDKERRSVLSCFHRNLMYASLQTEALAGLAELAVPLLGTPTPRDRAMEKHSKQAAHILGKLYNGEKLYTYRSRSPQRQIDDHLWKGEVDSLWRFWRTDAALGQS